MSDRSDLIRRADELRRQAEREQDESIRSRLIRMADHYMHLVESQTWSDAHPPNASSLGEIFTKSD